MCLQNKHFYNHLTILCRTRTFKVGLQTFRIRDEIVWIVDYVPESLALRVSSIVLNVNDEFVANAFCVRTISNDFRFNYQ